MKTRRFSLAILSATGTLALALAACGGGSGGSAAGGSVLPPPTTKSTQKLGVTLALASGSRTPFAKLRSLSTLHPLAISGAPVTVTYNGATVATGTLDANGFAELVFTQDVPAGATVTVTVGSGSSAVVASVTLATAISATAADIVYNSGPPATISVKESADANEDGQVDSGDSQQQTDTENPSNGDPEDVNSENDGTLPTNLPVTISVCNTSTITIAPAATAPSGLGLSFEEKVADSDSSPQFEYQTASFTGPLTFPYLSSAARIDMQITQSGQELLSIEAPIGAITGTPAPSPSASPASSPSASPSSSPSAAPSASPSASPTPSACPTLSPVTPG